MKRCGKVILNNTDSQQTQLENELDSLDPCTVTSINGVRCRNLEFHEQRFRISIIFLFAQIKDLSFPPIPGFHLDQFVQAWITHRSTATKQTLRKDQALTSFVHTAVSIIDYTTAQG